MIDGTTHRTPSQHARFAGLDLVRTFAAVAVMLFHLGYWSWATHASTAYAIVGDAVHFPALMPFAFWGRFGVETFFVVSGFVIAFSASAGGAARFVRSRVLRLVPAAIICATITALVSRAIGFGVDSLWHRYLMTLVFNPFGPWVDNVYWTLGVEISFYALVFALLAVRGLAWLETIMLTIGAASALPALWHAFGGPAFVPLAGVDVRVRELLLLDQGVYFAVGVVLWRGFADGWRYWRSAALVALAAGGAIKIFVDAGSVLERSATPALATIAAGIWLATIAAIAASIRFDESLFRDCQVRTLRPIRLLGLATYPLYLLHDVVGAATLRAACALGVPQYLSLAFAMTAMMALALAVTAFAEPPLRAALARLIDRRAQFRREAPQSSARR